MRGRIDSAAFFIHPMNQPPDSLLMKGIWGHETRPLGQKCGDRFFRMEETAYLVRLCMSQTIDSVMLRP